MLQRDVTSEIYLEREFPGRLQRSSWEKMESSGTEKQWNRENEKQGQARGNGSRMRQEGKTASPHCLRKPKKTFSHNMQVRIVGGVFWFVFICVCLGLDFVGVFLYLVVVFVCFVFCFALFRLVSKGVRVKLKRSKVFQVADRYLEVKAIWTQTKKGPSHERAGKEEIPSLSSFQRKSPSLQKREGWEGEGTGSFLDEPQHSWSMSFDWLSFFTCTGSYRLAKRECVCLVEEDRWRKWLLVWSDWHSLSIFHSQHNWIFIKVFTWMFMAFMTRTGSEAF